jgi:quinol monooxygenase YgiN
VGSSPQDGACRKAMAANTLAAPLSPHCSALFLLRNGGGKPNRSLWFSFPGILRARQRCNLIIESVRIAAMPAQCEQLRRGLVAWAGPTAVESGCLSCRILQESSAPQAFCYQAQWKTHDDLLRHIRTEHYKRLLALMELGTTPPLVEFHTVTETQGLDLIERARTSDFLPTGNAQRRN